MEILNFDRKCKCDWCDNIEICSITHYGTTHYNRVICLECALWILRNERQFGYIPFDLNNSTIRFNTFAYDITKEEE